MGDVSLAYPVLMANQLDAASIAAGGGKAATTSPPHENIVAPEHVATLAAVIIAVEAMVIGGHVALAGRAFPIFDAGHWMFERTSRCGHSPTQRATQVAYSNEIFRPLSQ
jgi:hypothetical protein